MTPVRTLWAIATRALLCRVGQHEDTTHTRDATEATADAPAQPAIIQQRCLHCGHLTKGWTQDAPRYAYSLGMERPDKGLVLHNGRLKRCLCVACETARATRRQRRAKVTTMRKIA